MPSAFSQAVLAEQLLATLGETLSETELSKYTKALEIIEPPVAKQFWDSRDGKAGIYIVLEGKVRLLDSAHNLITTLNTGTSFGEMTLFSEEHFEPYIAKASTKLQLCYLTKEVLQSLMRKYSSISDRQRRRAELWDLALLCRQNSQLENTSFEEILKALSYFTRHNLEIGAVPATIAKDSKLWLLRRGRLVHSQGESLSPGKISVVKQQGSWEATQSTIAYSLSDSDWQLALQHWSELAQLIGSDSHKDVDKLAVEVLTNDSNIIPFPQPGSEPKQKRKKQKAYFPSPKVQLGRWWGHVTKQYPFYAQQSASDCGAASLVMIGRYWGKRLSINKLRDLANVNRSGSSMRGLVAAAESIGFVTRPVKASLDKLAQQPLPAIAHWEGKHYIVVYAVTRNRVIVGDPAIGLRHLTKSEFKAGWTGYALLLQPTALLKQTKEATTSLWEFFDLIKPHSRVLLEIFIASVFIQIFGLVTPLLTQLLLDRVIVQGSTVTLNAIGFGLLIFSLFRIILTGLREYLLEHTANKVSVALLVGFIKHTLGLPLAFFESRYVGDIISRVQENQKIQRFLTGEALSIVLDLLTVFIYLGLMFWYSWQMGLLTLMIVPPFFLLALISTPFLRRISREIFNSVNDENSYLIEVITGIRSIRSMSIEQTVRWHWEELLNQAIKKTFSGQIIGNRLQIISSTIQAVITTGLLWLGAWQVIHSQLTIGQLVAFNMLLGNVISPFLRLSVLWNQLQEVLIATERINDVLKAELEEDLQQNSRQTLANLQSHIRFENVTFRYHQDSKINILENLSFEILPQQTVAVVGRSGSGKTTLSKLILGLYPATTGKVLIDGKDVTSISLNSLRSQIGVVDQDTFLFGGTIRENISIAHPEASLEEIREAARLAGADEFIQQLPLGYETQIGEGGGLLSGGQRQRLAIARALLGNPRLLLLDEATSNLDAESERIIQTNLNTILKGRTTIIIAHRLSTVRNADLILVLDRGVLIESGTHDGLIAKKGHYYYLNQQQLAQVG